MFSDLKILFFKGNLAIAKDKNSSYEIIIRKDINSEFIAYCPQINLMIRGSNPDDVQQELKDMIKLHFENISETESD